jgi:hypothetical protein
MPSYVLTVDVTVEAKDAKHAEALIVDAMLKGGEGYRADGTVKDASELPEHRLMCFTVRPQVQPPLFPTPK